MVGLREDREPAVLQAFDDVDLPQRARPVEVARLHPADELAELVEGARSRQRAAPDVVAEVERLVVDPYRVGDPARDEAHLLPVARNHRDALADQPTQGVVLVAGVGAVSRAEDRDLANVHCSGRALEVEERDVESREPFAHPVTGSSSAASPCSETPNSASSSPTVWSGLMWRTPTMPASTAPRTFGARSSTNTHCDGSRPSNAAVWR